MQEEHEERQSARPARPGTGRCRPRGSRGAGRGASTRRPRLRARPRAATASRTAIAANSAQPMHTAPRKTNEAFSPRGRVHGRQGQRGDGASDRNRRLADTEREPALIGREPLHDRAPAGRVHARAERAGNRQQRDQHRRTSPPSRPRRRARRIRPGRSPARCARRPGPRAAPRAAASRSARPRRWRARADLRSATGRTGRCSAGPRTGSPIRRPRSPPEQPCRPRARPSGSAGWRVAPSVRDSSRQVRMSNVDDAAVATYPALAVEEERSFLIAASSGWMCLGLAVTGRHRLGDRDERPGRQLGLRSPARLHRADHRPARPGRSARAPGRRR